MKYEFFEQDGVEMVRVHVSETEIVERVATADDHVCADASAVPDVPDEPTDEPTDEQAAIEHEFDEGLAEELDSEGAPKRKRKSR
jgi:hypothetical protein